MSTSNAPVIATPVDRIAKLIRMIATLTGNKEVLVSMNQEFVLAQAHRVGLKDQLVKAYASIESTN